MSASTIASRSTEKTTGVALKPIARRVAISTVLTLTAVYIVFSAANSAPIAMMVATTIAKIRKKLLR